MPTTPTQTIRRPFRIRIPIRSTASSPRRASARLARLRTATGFGVLADGDTYTGPYDATTQTTTSRSDRASPRRPTSTSSASSAARARRRHRRCHRLGLRPRHRRHQHVARICLRARRRPFRRRIDECGGSGRLGRHLRRQQRTVTVYHRLPGNQPPARLPRRRSTATRPCRASSSTSRQATRSPRSRRMASFRLTERATTSSCSPTIRQRRRTRRSGARRGLYRCRIDEGGNQLQSPSVARAPASPEPSSASRQAPLPWR